MIGPMTTRLPFTTPSGHIKKPPNAFFVFAQHARPQMQRVHPKANSQVINKLLGVTWKSLPASHRKLYIKQAEALDVLHRRLHPHFVAPTRVYQKPNSTAITIPFRGPRTAVVTTPGKKGCVPIRPRPGPLANRNPPSPVNLGSQRGRQSWRNGHVRREPTSALGDISRSTPVPSSNPQPDAAPNVLSASHSDQLTVTGLQVTNNNNNKNSRSTHSYPTNVRFRVVSRPQPLKPHPETAKSKSGFANSSDGSDTCDGFTDLATETDGRETESLANTLNEFICDSELCMEQSLDLSNSCTAKDLEHHIMFRTSTPIGSFKTSREDLNTNSCDGNPWWEEFDFLSSPLQESRNNSNGMKPQVQLSRDASEENPSRYHTDSSISLELDGSASNSTSMSLSERRRLLHEVKSRSNSTLPSQNTATSEWMPSQNYIRESQTNSGLQSPPPCGIDVSDMIKHRGPNTGPEGGVYCDASLFWNTIESWHTTLNTPPTPTVYHDSPFHESYSYTTTPRLESMIKLTPSISSPCQTTIFTSSSDESHSTRDLTQTVAALTRDQRDSRADFSSPPPGQDRNSMNIHQDPREVVNHSVVMDTEDPFADLTPNLHDFILMPSPLKTAPPESVQDPAERHSTTTATPTSHLDRPKSTPDRVRTGTKRRKLFESQTESKNDRQDGFSQTASSTSDYLTDLCHEIYASSTYIEETENAVQALLSCGFD